MDAPDPRPIDFTPDPELYPFESKWFESSAGPVHYIDEGEGRPILFCHGNPTWSFLYRDIVKELRGEFRCVAVDYPGFGLSARPQRGYGYTPAEHSEVIGALVDELGLQDFIVMAQDWGGPIGINLAADRADRVHGLVIGNTWCWPADDRGARIFSLVMSSPPLQYLILRRNFFVKPLMRFGLQRKLSAKEFNHYVAVQPSPAERTGAAVFPKEIRAAGPWLGELESKVKDNLAGKPLLLVWGMKDFAFKASYIDRWQAMFADNTLVELSDAGHYFQEDAPLDVVAAIRERFGAA